MKNIKNWLWGAIVFLALALLVGCQDDIPTVETIHAKLLSNGKIEVVGQVVSDGGAAIQQRGLLFSRHPNPTLSDENKSGANYDYDNHSLFSATFDNVGPNEECYVRAYAVNEVGVGYGEILNFKNSTKPVATTNPADGITKTEAVLKGIVNPLNSETEVWFEIWPKGGVSKDINLSLVSGEQTVEVSTKVEGLNISQIYYYVLKVRNEYGENIGDTIQFETYAVNDYDGNLYHIVDINGQVWLKENFKGTHYTNGDLIPYISNVEEWKNLSTGAYCWYNHDPEIGKEYGGLYNWYVASDPRGLIEGWHTPSNNEFVELFEFIKKGTLSQSATSLMESGNSHWLNPCSSPYLSANNSTGFTALPNGGLSISSNGFTGLGVYASYWSTEIFSGSANLISIFDCSLTTQGYLSPNFGGGIRLIKN